MWVMWRHVRNKLLCLFSCGIVTEQLCRSAGGFWSESALSSVPAPRCQLCWQLSIIYMAAENVTQISRTRCSGQTELPPTPHPPWAVWVEHRPKQIQPLCWSRAQRGGLAGPGTCCSDADTVSVQGSCQIISSPGKNLKMLSLQRKLCQSLKVQR